MQGSKNMSVKVGIPPFLLHLTGNARFVDVAGSNVGECLNALIERFPGVKSVVLNEKGDLLRHLDVYVNGQSSYPEDLAKPVHEGDELYIINIVVGG
jgi:molybdopterin synthase sulfur carrier subunit